MGTPLYFKGGKVGAVTGGVEFLAEDVLTGNIAGRGMDLIVEINITVGVTPNIEISYDSGATWTVLIPTLATNTITRVRTMAQGTDEVNFRGSVDLTLARFVVFGDPDA